MSYLQRALDFIAAAETATSPDELEEKLRVTLLEFGVTQFTLMALDTRPGNKARRPVPLTRATVRDWAIRYGERNYFNSDAVIHTAIRKSDAFTWEDLNPKQLSPTAKIILDEGQDILQVDGCLIIPTHDAKGFAGFISMFYPGQAPDQSMRMALKLITIYAMEMAKELHGLELDNAGWDTNCPLSLRQREALGFLAMGKTDWEISTILGISERTARHHADSARGILGVATRAQAVAVAVHRGWVSI